MAMVMACAISSAGAASAADADVQAWKSFAAQAGVQAQAVGLTESLHILSARTYSSEEERRQVIHNIAIRAAPVLAAADLITQASADQFRAAAPGRFIIVADGTVFDRRDRPKAMDMLRIAEETNPAMTEVLRKYDGTSQIMPKVRDLEKADVRTADRQWRDLALLGVVTFTIPRTMVKDTRPPEQILQSAALLAGAVADRMDWEHERGPRLEDLQKPRPDIDKVASNAAVQPVAYPVQMRAIQALLVSVGTNPTEEGRSAARGLAATLRPSQRVSPDPVTAGFIAACESAPVPSARTVQDAGFRALLGESAKP